jgi:hypothetical protein
MKKIEFKTGLIPEQTVYLALGEVMTEERIKEISKGLKGLVDTLKARIMVGHFEIIPSHCPEGRTGCCVYHTRQVKRDLNVGEITKLIDEIFAIK